MRAIINLNLIGKSFISSNQLHDSWRSLLHRLIEEKFQLSRVTAPFIPFLEALSFNIEYKEFN